MKIFRRKFLSALGLATAGSALGGLAGSCSGNNSNERNKSNVAKIQTDTVSIEDNWGAIRNNFNLESATIHMAGLLITSHPESVRNAIEKNRVALNENPAGYVRKQFTSMNRQLREMAADYMGVGADEVATTDSTTMGTALGITGLRIRSDQEVLTCRYDYYSTHKAIDYLCQRTGASVRKINLYQNLNKISEEEIINNLVQAIKPETRLVSATWVHSSTGLKVPISSIGRRINEINANRSSADRIIFFVDGVHGFGVENESIAQLNCDLFASGCHKWIHGPRGTGILYGNSRSHTEILPTIPTFDKSGGWGGRMSPGGFKPFEHEWALPEAFKMHQSIGKEKIRNRIHDLALQLKEGLNNMDGVNLITPLSANLSSGIICFEIENLTPIQVVNELDKRGIQASDTPYSPSYPRLSPCIYNTEHEIDKVLEAVNEIA